MEKHKKTVLFPLFCCQPASKSRDLLGRGVKFGQNIFLPKHSHVGTSLKYNFV